MRLGPAAVATYGEALLLARQELWPAFEGERRTALAPSKHIVRADLPDEHGAQLAIALRAFGVESPLIAPADCLPCTNRGTSHQRSFLGLVLRAWGEPDAARALRSVTEEKVRTLRTAWQPHDPESIRRVIHEATGEDRLPKRLAPIPAMFQYDVAHTRFE